MWRHTPYGDKFVTAILDLTPSKSAAVPRDSWTLSQATPSRSSKPGWPPAPIHGAATSRSLQWMDSPGLRAPPPKNSPMQGRLWMPSTSCTWLATPWMGAVDAFSKTFTTGVGGPRIPCTQPARCYTPDLACLHRVSSTNYSTCLPVTSTSHSRSPGAPIRTSLIPTVRPTRPRVRP